MIVFTTRCNDKLTTIHLNTVFTNQLSNVSLAPEKACTVLFGRGKFQITMKRQAACCMCQYHKSNSCQCAKKFETAGWKLHAFRLGKQSLQTCSEKNFY